MENINEASKGKVIESIDKDLNITFTDGTQLLYDLNQVGEICCVLATEDNALIFLATRFNQ